MLQVGSDDRFALESPQHLRIGKEIQQDLDRDQSLQLTVISPPDFRLCLRGRA